jgi:hypothetical protein
MQKFNTGAGCVINGPGCPSPPPAPPRLSPLVIKQVELIVSRKENYEWRGFKYPESIFAPVVLEKVVTPVAEVAIDLDAWDESAVVDLDAADAVPVKRKKARVVNLVKDEIKMQLKSEYTQDDIKRLFRSTDEKAPESVPVLDIPSILTVDFPRVLTAAEFERWKGFT